MTTPGTGWFYVVTEEAAPILAKIFKTGVRPGAAITVPPEDFEILREGTIFLPVTMVDNAQIIKIPPGIPRAS